MLKVLEDTHVIVSDLRFGKTILADYIKKFVIDALRSGKFLNGQHSDVYGNGYIWQAGFVQGSNGFWHCGHFYGR